MPLTLGTVASHFSPLESSAILGWYDAAATETLLNGAGEIAQPGEAVVTWKNRIPSAVSNRMRALVQGQTGTSFYPPTKLGNFAVNFNGINDFMTLPANIPGQPYFPEHLNILNEGAYRVPKPIPRYDYGVFIVYENTKQTVGTLIQQPKYIHANGWALESEVTPPVGQVGKKVWLSTTMWQNGGYTRFRLNHTDRPGINLNYVTCYRIHIYNDMYNDFVSRYDLPDPVRYINGWPWIQPGPGDDPWDETNYQGLYYNPADYSTQNPIIAQASSTQSAYFGGNIHEIIFTNNVKTATHSSLSVSEYNSIIKYLRTKWKI